MSNITDRILTICGWSLTSNSANEKDECVKTIQNLIRTDRLISTMAFEGMVKVIESGRDCDCVEYDGRVHIIEATLEAYEELDSNIGEWADGPYQLEIVHMSEHHEYSSRDLVLEAHEDGHRHSITSRFA